MNKLIDNDAYIPFAMAHAYAVKDGYKGNIQNFVELEYSLYRDSMVWMGKSALTYREWLKSFR